MKSLIKKRTYQAIYRLLDRVSPVQGDCGDLCGAACCTYGGGGSSEDSSDFDFGMYLLPGEEKLFTGKEDWLRWSSEPAEDYDFPESWSGKVHFIRCTTAPRCPRKNRPLQCRFFPLMPHLMEDGTLCLILYTGQLPYNCPLISQRIELQDRFICATYTVWKHLIKEPLIFDLVKMDSLDRKGDISIIKAR